MTDMVAWISLIGAGVLFLIGVGDLVQTWGKRTKAAEAVEKATALAKETNSSTETLSAQSATDFKGAWEALAALATALKDLDRSSRLFVLSLAFLAVAAAAAGIGSIAEAIQAP